MPEHSDEERRKAGKDRRARTQDRRNAERTADDFTPRRHPEIPDRRKSS